MEWINAVNTQNSDKTSNEYLEINNCGYYDISKTAVNVNRKKGRSDYQLIYLKSGSGAYKEGGFEYEIKSGDLILYKPYEEQTYNICALENSKMYWIHFTGTGVEELLKKSKISDTKCVNIGQNEEICDLFLKIINEITIKQEGYKLFCESYLINILSLVSRLNFLEKRERYNKKYEKIFAVIQKINTTPNDMSSIDDYAKMCSLSRFYFISLFKEFTGLSPVTYRTKVKVDAACRLICDTDMNISEIASFLGFADASYFSRIFKKYAGISPKKYKSGAGLR